jgi:hypothetical protein
MPGYRSTLAGNRTVLCTPRAQSVGVAADYGGGARARQPGKRSHFRTYGMRTDVGQLRRFMRRRNRQNPTSSAPAMLT